MANLSYANPTQELIERVSTEFTSISRRLEEINGQLESHKKTLQKEENHAQDLAGEIKNVHDNIDTMPRTDILEKYGAYADIRFRLATFRGQTDILKSKQEALEAEKIILADILQRIRGGVDLVQDTKDPVKNQGVIRILDSQEDERRRLANQMHDGPAQSLTNFVLQAEICQILFDRDPKSAADELARLKEVATTTIQRVRDFIFELRPMMLDDLGVIPTIYKYIEIFKEKSAIKTQIDLQESTNQGDKRKLESYQEVLIFRGLQELMVCARDFSEATHVDIYIELGKDKATISVKEDGREMVVENIFTEHSDDPRGQILRNLREKLQMVNGELIVYSDAQNRNEYKVNLPINDRQLLGRK